MTHSFQNLSTTKFAINGRSLFKTFLPVYIDDAHIRAVNIYDGSFALIGPTHVSEIEVDGVVYATSNALITVLHDVLYARSVSGELDNAQIEVNRLDIVGLEAGKSDLVHSHDDRYYTEVEIDAILAGLGASTPPITKGEVDGQQLNLRQANDTISASIDVSELRNQGAIVSYDGKTLSLKDASGNTLSTVDIEAKESFYDKARFLDGLEDDLTDLSMVDRFAIVRTTGSLYFFASKSDNPESLIDTRIHINTNDEFYEIGSPAIVGATFIAWAIPVVSDSFVAGNEYAFDFWTRNIQARILYWNGYRLYKEKGNHMPYPEIGEEIKGRGDGSLYGGEIVHLTAKVDNPAKIDTDFNFLTSYP